MYTFPRGLYFNSFSIWVFLRLNFSIHILFAGSHVFQVQVAEQMINPYGADDEDFELNYLLDRHAKVFPYWTSYLHSC